MSTPGDPTIEPERGSGRATRGVDRLEAVRKRAPLPLLLMALGPGLLGLLADNDAGGMLSYLVTGEHHALQWFLPALALLAAGTLFIQSVALRVVRATGAPYSRTLERRVGRGLMMTEALVLYGLNGLILVTEFLGMSMALNLAGAPRWLAAAAACLLVLWLTADHVYPRLERQLLWTAVANAAFIPALLTAGPTWTRIAAAWAPDTPGVPWFLLLALAGNAIAPWMIYWQQHAVVHGPPRSARQHRWDLYAGVALMVTMATVVLGLGGLVHPPERPAFSLLVALGAGAGHWTADLFAVGLFDAGLLAACTISLSSGWMLREAVDPPPAIGSTPRHRGRWRGIHGLTLVIAAGIAALPAVNPAAVALWAQAAGAVWLPVCLLLLSVVATDPRVMGRKVLRPVEWGLLAVLVLLFGVVAALGLGA